MPRYANPQNLNRYSYVTNNPLRYTDPTGHMQCEDYEGSCVSQNQVTKINKAKQEKNRQKSIKKNMRRGGNGGVGNGPTIGPLHPNDIFSSSFQMFPTTQPVSYGQVAEEGYTDFTWGGGGGGEMPGLLLDLHSGIEPWLRSRTTPFTQYVTFHHTTTYQNIPRVDATSVTTVNNLQIHNRSNINSVINYNVTVTLGNQNANSNVSAAPGQTADVPLSVNVSSGSAINVTIRASTECQSVCISVPNSLDFWGGTSFNYTP